MGAWLAYLGPEAANDLARLLGAGAPVWVGASGGLGIAPAGPSPATLTIDTEGSVTAAVGCDSDGGCSATLDRDGLTLRCDPFGLHGVYTTRRDDTLWCTSDLSLLRRLGGVEQLDPRALHGYLCFSHVPTPETIYRGIHALPAGTRRTVSTDGRINDCLRMWSESGPADLDEATAAGELRRRLQAAVARRLGAEHRVGVFLSGGLDSSLIAALLIEAGAQTRLFTLEFGPPFDAELPLARRVAEYLGQPLTIVPARPREVRAALDATGAALEQPFGDGVTVPLYLLGRAARQEVATIFNGEGGDQLFGGWANKPMLAAALYGLEKGDREAAYLATYHRFHGLTDRLYTAAARAATVGVDAGGWVRPALEATGFRTLLHLLRAANLRLKGAQNIAPRARQLAEAQGLRACAPFFDQQLADWTFSLSPDWFLRGACEKYLLKRVAAAYLPEEVVWRAKRGMGVPVSDWARGPLRREVARRLPPRRLKQGGWFDPGFVTALLRDEAALPGDFRRRRAGENLWALFMLQVWQEAQGVAV